MNHLTFVDLFAGIGGLRIGFEKACESAGISTTCVASSEIDQACQAVYQLNFGELPLGDIKQIENLPKHDVMLAGFPCQSFSYGGSMKGFADTRGTLFFELARLLEICKPSYFLFENVRGLMRHDGGRTYKTIEDVLTNLGYSVQPIQLNSSHYGVPQNRPRVYIVGALHSDVSIDIADNLGSPDTHAHKRDNRSSQSRFWDDGSRLTDVRDILEKDPDSKYFCSDEFTKRLYKATNENFEALHGVRLMDYRNGNSLHSWELGMRGECTENEIRLMDAIVANRRKKKFGTHQDGKKLTKEQISTFWQENNLDELLDSLVEKRYLSNREGKYNPMAGNYSFEVFKFLDPDGISVTLTASDCNRLGIVQNKIPRRITPRECARLQGFPDDFKFSDDDKESYKQIGNSVSVPVVETVWENFLQSLNK